MVKTKPRQFPGLLRNDCIVLLMLVTVSVTGCMSIHEAARNGNAAQVEKQLAWGVNPNSTNMFALDTPLIEAALGGHADVVMLLLENGADVNLKGEAWYGPLHAAAMNGHVEVVRILLDNGADVNIWHNKPLNYAAGGGHIEIAEILLEHGANINAKGTDEYTPLGTAAAAQQVEMVRFLLSKGADVNARALYDATPLFTAVSDNDFELASLLLEAGADVGIKCNGRPALLASVLNNDAKMTELLLINGANPNDAYEDIPLYFAYRRDNVQIGKLLLKHGADPTLTKDAHKIPKSFIEKLRNCTQ